MHSLQIKKQFHRLSPDQEPSGVIRVSPVEPNKASFRPLTSVLRHQSLLLDVSVLYAVFLYESGGHVLPDVFVFQKTPQISLLKGQNKARKSQIVPCDTFETTLCFSKLYGEGDVSEMFLLTHHKLGVFLVFLTFGVNFYNKKSSWLYSSQIFLCLLCLTVLSARDELFYLFEASWDRQRLSALMEVAESQSRDCVLRPPK